MGRSGNKLGCAGSACLTRTGEFDPSEPLSPGAVARSHTRPTPMDTPKAPEQDQTNDATDDVTKATVSTPETEGERVAEAGHGYVGRTMSDDVKTTSREEGSGEAE